MTYRHGESWNCSDGCNSWSVVTFTFALITCLAFLLIPLDLLSAVFAVMELLEPLYCSVVSSTCYLQ